MKAITIISLNNLNSQCVFLLAQYTLNICFKSALLYIKLFALAYWVLTHSQAVRAAKLNFYCSYLRLTCTLRRSFGKFHLQV